MSVGPRGPLLMQDFEYLEEMAHFDRERIPERVVHAKGAGAFGYFEVTHDITKYSKAKVFSGIGKKTNVAVRFSTVGKFPWNFLMMMVNVPLLKTFLIHTHTHTKHFAHVCKTLSRITKF